MSLAVTSKTVPNPYCLQANIVISAQCVTQLEKMAISDALPLEDGV